MSANQNQVAVLDAKPSVTKRLAEHYGVDQDKFLQTLKATAFRSAGDISDAQMMALLVVAEAHGLNPFLKEMYAFPSQNGIIAVVGVDGWAKLINQHPQFNGMSFEQDDEKCTCTMHRKDRAHPVIVTEYKAECSRNTGPWQTHPKRMLRHKAMIQCARLAFSFAGVSDPDEAERIQEAEMIDVTPRDDVDAGITSSQGRKLVSPVKLRKVVEGLMAAVAAKDGKALWAIIHENDMTKDLDAPRYIWSKLRSWESREINELLNATKQYRVEGIDLGAWAVTTLKGCASGPDVLAAYDAIQAAYADEDLEVPADIQTVFGDLKQALAVP